MSEITPPPGAPRVESSPDDEEPGTIHPVTWVAIGAGLVTAIGFAAVMFGAFDRATPTGNSRSTAAKTAEPAPEWFSNGDKPLANSEKVQTTITAEARDTQVGGLWDDRLWHSPDKTPQFSPSRKGRDATTGKKKRRSAN